MIYYPMLFVRGLFMGFARFFGVMSFLGFLASLFAEWMPWEAKLIMIAVSFSLFLLRQFYDQILLKLNPSNTELTLYQ